MHDSDRYDLVRDIGSGNFGTARLLRDRKTKELVAVKYIERGDKEVKDLFLLETAREFLTAGRKDGEMGCHRNPKFPDFKHKDTGESLWIEGRYNPPWMKSQLAILDARMESFQDQNDSMPANFVAGDNYASF